MVEDALASIQCGKAAGCETLAVQVKTSHTREQIISSFDHTQTSS